MVSVKNIFRKFGNVEALKGISFQIEKGEIYGLLGPNGAGKTTTISILSTLTQPDSGEVFINGLDLSKDSQKIKKIIGVVPQEIALYQELSAYDNLIFWGGLYSIPSVKLKEKVNEILKLVGLFERKDDKIKTYSGGMKRRINIASALLHSPEIIFMDEPTVGIDPQSRNLIYEVIEKLNSRGMTMIYTTHYMEEAERLCKRIGIIDNGKIVAQGTLDELRAQTDSKPSILIKVDGTINENTVRDFTKEESAETPGTSFSFKDNTLRFFSSDVNTDLPRLINRLSKYGLKINEVGMHRATLESIFLSLTGKELRD